MHRSHARNRPVPGSLEFRRVLLGVAVLLASVACRSEPKPVSRLPLWTSPPDAISLEADVRFTGTEFVVQNRSPDLWHDVEVAVGRVDDPPAYRYRAGAVFGGRSLTIGALHFARPNDMRLNPFRVHPDRWMVSVRLDDGRRGFVEGTFASF
jgi:hypothetical protein